MLLVSYSGNWVWRWPGKQPWHPAQPSSKVALPRSESTTRRSACPAASAAIEFAHGGHGGRSVTTHLWVPSPCALSLVVVASCSLPREFVVAVVSAGAADGTLRWTSGGVTLSVAAARLAGQSRVSLPWASLRGQDRGRRALYRASSWWSSSRRARQMGPCGGPPGG